MTEKELIKKNKERCMREHMNLCEYSRHMGGDMFATCLNPYCGPAICSYAKSVTSCPFFLQQEQKAISRNKEKVLSKRGKS